MFPHPTLYKCGGDTDGHSQRGHGMSAFYYECPLCQVQGYGDECWSCGSVESRRYILSPTAVPSTKLGRGALVTDLLDDTKEAEAA